MGQKRIDEIKDYWLHVQHNYEQVSRTLYIQDVGDLLNALEKAQSYAAGIQAGVDHLREERDRLRETLERVELHAMWSYESGQDAAGKWHEVRFCVECGALFKRANGDVDFDGRHTGECAFARVRGGDNS